MAEIAKALGEAVLGAIVKNLELRWGLSLVSFAPEEAHDSLVDLQRRLGELGSGRSTGDLRCGRPWISLHGRDHFHCTHMTLRRSDPAGPIQEADFVREGHRLSDLLDQIHQVTRAHEPIEVQFDRARIGSDGLGLVLFGRTRGQASLDSRHAVMKRIGDLGTLIDIQGRSYDRDDPGKVHLALGFLKRMPQVGALRFTEVVEALDVRLRFTLRTLSLVHHRQRSLKPPQQGEVRFLFGDSTTPDLRSMAEALGLLSTAERNGIEGVDSVNIVP